MATGYTRVSSANIVAGGVVRSSLFNNEFDAIQAAFSAATGHSHDGTTGGGAPVSKWALGTSALTSPAGYIAGDTNTGIGQVGGADTLSLIAGGSEAIRANGVASGVNYVGVTGAATGNPAAIAFTGSDANVGGGIYTKGTGWLGLYPGGFPSLSVAPVTNAVNYIKAAGAVTGSAPFIAFEGPDTNVAGGIYTKGTGALSLMPGGTLAAQMLAVAGSNRAVTISGSNGGNPTISTSAGDLNLTSASGTVRVNGTALTSGVTTGKSIAMAIVFG